MDENEFVFMQKNDSTPNSQTLCIINTYGLRVVKLVWNNEKKHSTFQNYGYIISLE